MVRQVRASAEDPRAAGGWDNADAWDLDRWLWGRDGVGLTVADDDGLTRFRALVSESTQ